MLEFSQIGGNVPNRGSTGQQDINIFGLTYLQRVSDAVTNGALHIEPGLWLFVPETAVPKQGPTVVRQGSIPHGTSIMAQGDVIPTIHGRPVDQARRLDAVQRVRSAHEPRLLGPISQSPAAAARVSNRPISKTPTWPFKTLSPRQTIVETVVLSVSTFR